MDMHLSLSDFFVRPQNAQIYLFDLLIVYQLSSHFLKDHLKKKQLNTILPVINVAFKKIEGGISSPLIIGISFYGMNFHDTNFLDMNFQSLLTGIIFLLTRDNLSDINALTFAISDFH
jgi:hypothetical protein